MRRGLEDELLALADSAGFGTGAEVRDYPQGLLAGEPDAPPHESRVQLWVPDASFAALDGWLAELRASWSLSMAELRVLGHEPADLDADPELLWQSRWKPFRCAGFSLRAGFHDAAKLPFKAGDQPLVVLPGSAFGNGFHVTTRMALMAVRRISKVRAPDRWLDVGTGSGILAVAAALLGAERVHGMDPDPHSPTQAMRMARANCVGERISVWQGELASACGRYSVVVANLFADLLQDAASVLAARLTPDGILYAGGIVDAKWELTASRLQAAGLSLRGIQARGRWRGSLWMRQRS